MGVELARDRLTDDCCKALVFKNCLSMLCLFYFLQKNLCLNLVDYFGFQLRKYYLRGEMVDLIVLSSMEYLQSYLL